jgi:hypothetical protein
MIGQLAGVADRRVLGTDLDGTLIPWPDDEQPLTG